MDFVRFECREGQGALPAGRGDGFASWVDQNVDSWMLES